MQAAASFATRVTPFAPAVGRRQLVIQCAHKKGAGSTKNGRDSNAQRRGVKVYGGQPVKAGGIIVRQLGSVVSPWGLLSLLLGVWDRLLQVGG